MPSKRKEALASKRVRGRKKIILVILEGKSDNKALMEILANTCYTLDPNVEVYPRYLKPDPGRPDGGGDVTSKYGVNPDTIERVIDKLVLRQFFVDQRLYPKDIFKVVQLVDTDGAFVDDSAIVEAAPNAHGLEYHDNAIIAPNVSKISERNAMKSENLRHLSGMSAIKTGFDKRKRAIPYRVYFFSSNLDHYLHGDANLPSNLKQLRAEEFRNDCAMRPSLFFETMQQDVDYVQCGYKESWSRIQIGCNSLQRHSNLGIFLDELAKEL